MNDRIIFSVIEIKFVMIGIVCLFVKKFRYLGS